MSMSFSTAAPLHGQPNGYTWPQPDQDINSTRSQDSVKEAVYAGQLSLQLVLVSSVVSSLTDFDTFSQTHSAWNSEKQRIWNLCFRPKCSTGVLPPSVFLKSCFI